MKRPISQSIEKQPSLSWTFLLLVMLSIVSCDRTENEVDFLVEEKLGEIRSITTRFTSHQADTEQKTGKIVSIATFNLDGTLDNFVSKTTYPYDRAFEVEKEFWEEPIRKNIFYIMDGLHTGDAEKSLLYGNDWPNAYYKHLMKESSDEVSSRYPWKQKVSTDNESLPTEIKIQRTSQIPVEDLLFPDIKQFYSYHEGKVTQVSTMNIYKEVDSAAMANLEGIPREAFSSRKPGPGEKKIVAEYDYEGDLLKTIRSGKYRHEFRYERGTLVRSEYYINEELVNTRFHYYRNGLKDRTEIFNTFKEPEYTVHYEYEFWNQPE